MTNDLLTKKLEEFEKKFDSVNGYQSFEMVPWLREFALEIIESVVREVEGMKKSADDTMGKAGDHYAGYSQALSTLKTRLMDMKKVEGKI